MNKIADLLQTTFPNAICLRAFFAFQFRFQKRHSQQTIGEIDPGKRLAPNRQHAIIWNNDDLVHLLVHIHQDSMSWLIDESLNFIATGCNTFSNHNVKSNWALLHISDETSYCEISQSLEAVRFIFRTARSFWNLTGTSVALLPMCLSNSKAMRRFKLPISRLRDFTRSCDMTSYRNGTLEPRNLILSVIFHNTSTHVIPACLCRVRF